MNLWAFKLKDLTDRCNNIAYELSMELIHNGFIDRIYNSLPVSSFFCIFNTNIDYDLLQDGNIIADNILKHYITEYSEKSFCDAFINNTPIAINELFSIKMGLPYINTQGIYKNTQNIRHYWNKTLSELLCRYQTDDWLYHKGCTIIDKYYKLIENEQNKYNQIREERIFFAQYVLDNYNKSDNYVGDYITHILANSFYLFDFDSNPKIEYNKENKSILVEYYLPQLCDIPNTIYKNKKGKILSTSAHNKLYDDIIYKIVIRSISEIFHFDSLKKINTIFFNGRIISNSTATGKYIDNCILSISVNRDNFEDIDLNYINAKECFKHFKGISASKIHTITPIPPIITFNKNDKRFIENKKISINQGTNLASMHWEDFEHLVRELFEMEFSKNGSEVKVTQASRDGGVDAIIFDPDPLRGGKIVVQAKRYVNTVGVSAVRDLYGTVINEGANTGILITTSNYGNDSYEFAKDKPLKLLNGAHLLALLHKNGINADINIELAKKQLKNDIDL